MKRFLLLLSCVLLCVCLASVLCACGCSHKNTVTEGAVKATCESDGYSGDTKCADCGQIIEKGSVIPARGHSAGTPIGASEPTCEEPGWTGRVGCLYCGTVLSQSEEIPALGHDIGGWTGTIAPTCTSTGRTGRGYCSRCGAIYNDRSVDMLDHTMENGVCSVCGWKDSGLYQDGVLVSDWASLVESGAVKMSGSTLWKLDDSLTGQLVLDESVGDIEDTVFDGSSLTEIWLHRKLRSFKGLCAAGSSVTTIRFFAQGVALPKDFCCGCAMLTTVDFLYPPASMDIDCFSCCTSLETIDLSGGSLASIGYYCFAGCTALRTVYLPEGLNEIYWGAFNNCSGLTLYYPGTEEQWSAVDIGTNLPDDTVVVFGAEG